MQQETSSNYERIEDDGEVFYSIFSRYDKEVLHIDPVQLQELKQWLADNEQEILQDTQRG